MLSQIFEIFEQYNNWLNANTFLFLSLFVPCGFASCLYPISLLFRPTCALVISNLMINSQSTVLLSVAWLTPVLLPVWLAPVPCLLTVAQLIPVPSAVQLAVIGLVNSNSSPPVYSSASPCSSSLVSGTTNTHCSPVGGPSTPAPHLLSAA